MGNYVVEGRADLPLGTTEAAVRSCVSVIAAVTSQREEILAYWLDLYYQVRRAYEIDQGCETDPRLIRQEDLYPVMRELMKDALKSTAKEEAKKELADAEKAREKKRRQTPFKRQVTDQLEAARAAGVTIAQIVEASGGKLTAEQVLAILEKKTLDPGVYVFLQDALNKLPAAAE